MSDLLQHLLALVVVAACVGWVGWQGVQAFRGRKSRIGSCCAKGCPTGTEPPARAADGTAGAPAGERVAFIPADDLLARARSRGRSRARRG